MMNEYEYLIFVKLFNKFKEIKHLVPEYDKDIENIIEDCEFIINKYEL